MPPKTLISQTRNRVKQLSIDHRQGDIIQNWNRVASTGKGADRGELAVDDDWRGEDCSRFSIPGGDVALGYGRLGFVWQLGQAEIKNGEQGGASSHEGR